MSGAGAADGSTMPARVRALTRLATDTVLLHLRTAPSRVLRYQAGQSTVLACRDASGSASETFALASCPCDERDLRFHVALEGAGAVTQRVREQRLAPGDEILVAPPTGSCVLDPTDMRPPLFMACDTGFAPIQGLIDYALSLDGFETMSLYWLATRPGGHYLANLCRSWAAGLDRFQYVAISDASPAGGARQLAARVLTDHRTLERRALYLAGPRAFVDIVSGLLAQPPSAGAIRINCID